MRTSPRARQFASTLHIPLPLLLFTILLVASVLVRLWQIHQMTFDGLYGQDPYAYYNYAVSPLRDSLLALAAPPPFTWPPGYPYLIALVSLVTGTTPLAGQIVSLGSALVGSAATALLTWEVWGRRKQELWSAALAGTLVALNGQFWQSSVVVMADTAALAAATTGMWALARYGRRDEQNRHTASGVWLVLAAASLAFAVLCRWAYALVALLAFGYALYLLWKQPRRQALMHGTAAAVAVLMVLAPIVGPLSSFLLGKAPERAPFLIDLQVYTWIPANFLRRTTQSPDGVNSYRLPMSVYYWGAAAHRYYFTPLIALLLLPGLVTTWRRRTLALLWLVWGWAALVLFFLSGVPLQNLRFTLTYLPPLAVLAGVGFTALWTARGLWRLAAVGLLALGLPAMLYGGLNLSNTFMERKAGELEIIRWTETELEADAALLTFNQTLAFRQYSELEVLEFFYETPKTLTAHLESNQPVYLLLDVQNVGTQWRSLAPGVNYAWLQREYRLLPLGQHGAYSLFRIVDS